MRRKWKLVSLYVEWSGDDGSEALERTLIRNGAHGVEIDRDVDIESYPYPGVRREHTVFRILVDREYPTYQLLADVSMHPGVFSAGEM